MIGRRGRAGQAGLTMIEIMVSVALVGIATAFVFSIQIRMSSALRDQQTVSETQQTLRSATELILRDVRSAGFLASLTAVVPGAVPWTQNPIGPVTVVNGGLDGAPDQLLIIAADTSAVTVVNSSGALLPALPNAPANYTTATGTNVVSSAGFAPGFAPPGNPVLFSYSLPNVTNVDAGKGCILGVTGVGPTVIVTDPAGGAPWNSPGNAHCVVGIANFQSLYTSGLTEVTKVVLHAYRIRPGDGRGVLEMSPSGGRVNGDYQPLALGIVDMQIALRIGNLATDPAIANCAIDGDAHHDWVSSDNMTGAFVNSARIVGVSITLLAKTTKEVQGVTIAQTPDLFDGDVGHRACNHVGDVAGKALVPTITLTTSPYFGEHAYRTYTATVDLRNANANGNLAN